LLAGISRTLEGLVGGTAMLCSGLKFKSSQPGNNFTGFLQEILRTSLDCSMRQHFVESTKIWRRGNMESIEISLEDR